MQVSEFDRVVRRQFQDSVKRLAPAGSSILDFGAGTGLDTKAYAQDGYKVHAYDASHDMRTYLAGYCRDEIASGQVALVDEDYNRFLASSAAENASVQAITSDFAVLNLVPDLVPLFKAFDRWLAADGFILASLLNPLYVDDARHLWWWQGMPSLLVSGRYSHRSHEGICHRFRLRAVEAAAQPYFTLVGVRAPHAATALPLGSAGTLALSTSLYSFLLFRRR